MWVKINLRPNQIYAITKGHHETTLRCHIHYSMRFQGTKRIQGQLRVCAMLEVDYFTFTTPSLKYL